MLRTLTASLALATTVSAPAFAASERFGMSYHVERVAAARLSIANCLATAEKASAALGYAASIRQNHPRQLAVFASGPKSGGGSLTVYCIAVDTKTAFVVQALDYNRANSAAAQKAADSVRQALLRASADSA